MGPYLRLMRFDRPVGTLLLLWPTLWALWLAAGRVPDLHHLGVFMSGVFLMRSAGCVINDYADRHIDGKVRRTCHRPFPQGEISIGGCKILLLVLVSMAFFLVLTLNRLTIMLSTVALLLAWFYPFAKRIMALPQLVLGLAYGWSIPMAFAAVSGHLPLTCWLLLLANLCWVIAYDTQYALADREDDLNIGVKSAAILFGRFSVPMISLLQLMTLLLMIGVGKLNQLGAPFYCALLFTVLLFLQQQCWLARQQPDCYLRAFSSNNWVGLALFLGFWVT